MLTEAGRLGRLSVKDLNSERVFDSIRPNCTLLDIGVAIPILILIDCMESWNRPFRNGLTRAFKPFEGVVNNVIFGRNMPPDLKDYIRSKNIQMQWHSVVKWMVEFISFPLSSDKIYSLLGRNCFSGDGIIVFREGVFLSSYNRATVYGQLFQSLYELECLLRHARNGRFHDWNMLRWITVENYSSLVTLLIQSEQTDFIEFDVKFHEGIFNVIERFFLNPANRTLDFNKIFSESTKEFLGTPPSLFEDAEFLNCEDFYPIPSAPPPPYSSFSLPVIIPSAPPPPPGDPYPPFPPNDYPDFKK